MENNVLNELYDVVMTRKTEPQEGSYTSYLFDAGLDQILKKIGEESAETIIAAKNGDKEPLIGEISDLIYHLTVMMAQCGVTYEEIFAELSERSKKIGNLKKFRSTDRNT